MRRTILIFALLLIPMSSAFAVQRTISWDPVTTYTNNTQIVSPDNGVIVLPITYEIKMDNVLICATTNVSCVIEHINADQDHIFNARALLATGLPSEWSPNFPWHCPPAGVLSDIPAEPIYIGPIRRP